MGIKIEGPKRGNSRVSQVQEGPGTTIQGPAAGGEQGKGASDSAAAATSNGVAAAGAGSIVADINVIKPGQKAKSVGLPSVKGDIPAPKTQKTKNGSSKKPAKQNDTQLTADMVAQVLGVTFNLLATRMGPHWALSQTEAQALADPTARILARYDLTSKTGTYADFIALGVAVVGIIIPKFLIHSQAKPKPKGEIQRGMEPVRQQQRPATNSAGDANTQAGTPNRSSAGVDRPAPASSPGNASIKQHLGSVISAI